MRDQNALAPTILPSDSEGIVSFVKGQQQQKADQDYRDGVLGQKKNADKQSRIDKLAIAIPPYWQQYEGYMQETHKSLVDKYSTIMAESDGILTTEQRGEYERDIARFKTMAESSIDLKEIYETSLPKLGTPEYNSPRNKERMSYITDPLAHATKEGKLAEFEESGPIIYYKENFGNEPMLKQNWDPSKYIKETFQSEIDDLDSEIDRTWGAEDGSSGQTTIEERKLEAVDGLLQNKYLLNKFFANGVNEIAVEKGIKPEEVVSGMAKDYEIKKRVTKTDYQAPKKDKNTTVRYISSKGKLTEAFENTLSVNQKIDMGNGRHTTAQYLSSSSDLKMVHSTGQVKIYDTENGLWKDEKGVKELTLGKGYVFTDDGVNFYWKGEVSGIGVPGEDDVSKPQSGLIDATVIAHPEIKAQVEAIKLKIQQEQKSSGKNTTAKKPRPY
jgi:hypothetical protein